MERSQSQPSADAGTLPALAQGAQPSAMERLTAVLAAYDARVAKCPVNNFQVERRTYGPNDRCSACGAVASGNCGKEVGASYELINAVRAITHAEAA